MYLALLALSASLKTDISERRSSEIDEAARILTHIKSIPKLLRERPDDFYVKYLIGFQVLAGTATQSNSSDDSGISQSMYNAISRASFTSLYRSLLMRIDGYNAVSKSQSANAQK